MLGAHFQCEAAQVEPRHILQHTLQLAGLRPLVDLQHLRGLRQHRSGRAGGFPDERRNLPGRFRGSLFHQVADAALTRTRVVLRSLVDKQVRGVAERIGQVERVRAGLRNPARGGAQIAVEALQAAGIEPRPGTLQARLEGGLDPQPQRADLAAHRLPREFCVPVIKRKDAGIQPILQQVTVLGLDADGVHRQVQPQIRAEMSGHVIQRAVAVRRRQQVGLAQQHRRGDAGIVERLHCRQIIFSERGPGVDQHHSQIAAWKIGPGFGGARGGQRAKARVST